MTNIKTSKIGPLVNQINRLQNAGCELIRVSVLDFNDARAIKVIKKEINIPLCADIHFNHKLALDAIKSGSDKIRINPGNIKKKNLIKEIISAAKLENIPVRIGSNSGSLDVNKSREKSLGKQLANSILKILKYIESLRFNKLIISAKAHNVKDTIEAYKIIAEKTDYPLHLGVTASGRGEYAIVKSAIGIGSLLSYGIGDTIRVSLTDDPVNEIKVGYEILQSLGLKKREWEVISCPTCGRTEIDVISLSKKVESLLMNKKIHLPKVPYRIAVMGCVVNGPGESKDADIGISGGRGFGYIFKNGKLLFKVEEKKLLSTLLKKIKQK